MPPQDKLMEIASAKLVEISAAKKTAKLPWNVVLDKSRKALWLNERGIFHKISFWDLKMMCAARFFGSWSKCLSRQIGAVIVDGKTIVATGYNGPPRGVPECDSPERLEQFLKEMPGTYSDHSKQRLREQWGTDCPRRLLSFGSGGGLFLCPAGHAETNAITNAARQGVPVKDLTMYCYCPLPCMGCSKDIVNSGLATVYYIEGADYDKTSRWILDNAEINLIPVPKELVDLEWNMLLLKMETPGCCTAKDSS